MNNSSPIKSLIIVLAGFLLTQQGAAQDLNAAEQAQIRQAVRESISSISSYNGIEGIPIRELYMMLFAEILIAPEDAYGFTSEDWEIISSLPSHSDRRFRAITDQEIETFCRFVETEKRETVAAAIEVAAYYEKAKTATDQLLDRHYEAVIASLSEQGQAALQQRVKSMNERMELVHTDINVRSIAQSAPAYSIRMLKSGCTSIKAQRAADPAGSLLLSEKLIRNANIQTPTTTVDPAVSISQ